MSSCYKRLLANTEFDTTMLKGFPSTQLPVSIIVAIQPFFSPSATNADDQDYLWQAKAALLTRYIELGSADNSITMTGL